MNLTELPLNNRIGTLHVAPIALCRNAFECVCRSVLANAKYNRDSADNCQANPVMIWCHARSLQYRHRKLQMIWFSKFLLTLVAKELCFGSLPGGILVQFNSKPTLFVLLSDRNQKYRVFCVEMMFPPFGKSVPQKRPITYEADDRPS